MIDVDAVAAKVEWLMALQEDLELAERLETDHGLEFTDDEKSQLRTLRQSIPKIQALFAKVRAAPQTTP